jgi:aspartyl-tRNA(Asn)/glutamyl-tRNA(Gln) amidotransferase subunit B
LPERDPTAPTRYEAVIGLEIHAHLRTRTKIFCGCSTAFGGSPNAHACPICLGFPGVLPVLNRAAVDLGIRAGLALGCHINTRSIFARKNYFYPDLPKGYQISQYDQPLASRGLVAYDTSAGARRIGITRIHLEEDAGKLLHEGFADSGRKSYVDYNRSGVPLIEIVTEPDLRSAADASEFFSRLRAILVWLEVNDGNMEEGSLRCDANVSVRHAGASELGTKVEVKNLNSFRFLQKALEYEIDRQTEVIERGGRVVQETRLWDPAAGETMSMRSKEEAHDYRYFPEPDLPPVLVDDERIEHIRDGLPELPDERRRRFVAAHGLSEQDAAQLTQSRALSDFFEQTVAAGASARQASNWLRGELAHALKARNADIAESPVPPDRLAALLALIDRGTISSAIAKSVFETMLQTGDHPAEIVRAQGLTQIDDESKIAGLIADVLSVHADAVAQCRAGKGSAFGFLVGQVMKAAGGKANPKRVNDLLKAALDA